jgi:hypothetical protein
VSCVDSGGYRAYLRVSGEAQVAELVDALDSGSSGRKLVEVRVFSWAPPPAGGTAAPRRTE